MISKNQGTALTDTWRASVTLRFNSKERARLKPALQLVMALRRFMTLTTPPI